MTIHELFDQEEQELINEALEMLRKKCKQHAEAPIKGYGKATEYEKKKQWADKQYYVEQLQDKIVGLSI